MSNPLSLEVLEALYVDLMVRVAHVGNDAAILHLVHVLARDYMLCAWRTGGREGRREERRREGRREGGRRKGKRKRGSVDGEMERS